MSPNMLEFKLSQTANSYFLTSESLDDFTISLKTDGGLNSFMNVFKAGLELYLVVQDKHLKDISTEQISLNGENSEYKITAKFVPIQNFLSVPTLQ